MNRTARTAACLVPMVALFLQGCAVSKVDFSEIPRPPRAPELDAYNVFLCSWNWEANIVTPDGPGDKWTGTADWHWTLDTRTPSGNLSAKSEHAEFNAAGVWSWHPKSKKYSWWMFNNWGYPQQGTARYDATRKHWKMDYKSVGLDGTTSHGCYEMVVVDDNTLDWRAREWAGPLHLVKKMEMKGVYRRK